VESDPTRMCELLVGLPEINVLGVVDEVDEMLQVHVETRVDRTGCRRRGVVARVTSMSVSLDGRRSRGGTPTETSSLGAAPTKRTNESCSILMFMFQGLSTTMEMDWL
jgi:metal-dependent amidase/aminoacylase/carboxypeptidase family protein